MFNKFGLLAIIIFSLIIFSPALGNFFWGDDWYHLQVSRISNFQEFFNFFSFQFTPQSTPFYRPISTQLFFFSFNYLFGLNAFPYYFFLLIIFAVSLWLLFIFILLIINDKKIALLATFIYGISATNFPRLYYLSNLQEILMTVFILASLIFYLKNTLKNIILSLLFFLFALGCKETAIVLPLILFIFNYLNKKFSFVRLWPYIFIAFLYIVVRLIFWNTYGKDNYSFDLSPFKAINTLGWYILWSFGVPEFLVDYIGSGFKILSRFYSDFQATSYILLTLISFVILSFVSIVIVNIKKINRIFIFFLSFFIIGLLPIIFLPWHKFAYEITLPMIGFAGALAFILVNKKSHILLSIIFLIFFCSLNLFTIFLDYQRHQSVTRSVISYKVYKYFKETYPIPPQNSFFEFINDTPVVNQYWGSSKQIDQAVSQSNLFKVLYKNHDYLVFYEDIPTQKPIGKKQISVSTAQFLNK